jgi:phage terminase large subunit
MDHSEQEILALADSLADPVFFAEHVLGVEPWSKQKEILRAVQHHNRIAVRSGHKVSKSHSMAVLALWWAITMPDARVALTSASFQQVVKILWREISGMYRKADLRVPLGGQLYRDPSSGLIFPNGNEIFGFSTDQPERAAGISAANLLYIVDEASGVQENVFEAMEGNMAAGAKMVLTSNPTRMVGTFFDAFHSKSKYWKCIHISSRNSPNVTGERKIPGLAGPEWIKEKAEEWGEGSPMFQVRVEGNFPGPGDNSVIGLALATEAKIRWANASTMGPLRIGVDVARYGEDETVIQPVRGFKALEPVTGLNMNGQQVAAKVMETIERLKRPTDDKVYVKIDIIGLGASPADFLGVMDRAKDSGVVVRPVNVANASDKPEIYADLRSQLCFDLKEWFEAGGAISDDEKLIQEIVAATYELDAKGRNRVLGKKAERKLLGRSPDRRNALELAIYEARPRRTIGGQQILM